jgi:biopolymer transport protein TolR
MIRTRSSKSGKIITGINITPFTDVLLVLLIIFMVTASQLFKNESQFQISLPKGQGSTTELPRSVIIMISRDQKIKVNDELIMLSDLSGKLKYLNRGNTVKNLVIKADEKIPYGTAIKVMDDAGKAGISGISLVAQIEPEE